MDPSNKRLTFLEQTVSSGSTDPFVWYGLALEYRNLERWEDALGLFEKLRDVQPDYVPMYLMCGQMLEQLLRPKEARVWFQQGVEVAKARKEMHALSELEAALAALD